jgi:hypothetical protein
MSYSSDGHRLDFTQVVGVVYCDVFEEHTAAVFRVT